MEFCHIFCWSVAVGNCPSFINNNYLMVNLGSLQRFTALLSLNAFVKIAQEAILIFKFDNESIFGQTFLSYHHRVKIIWFTLI